MLVGIVSARVLKGRKKPSKWRAALFDRNIRDLFAFLFGLVLFDRVSEGS